MDDLTLTVYIADRPYRLKIRADESDLIQRAVGEINSLIKEFSGIYAYNDRQDLLAMAALSFAGKNISGSQAPPGPESQQLITRLELLHRLIDEAAV